MRRSVFLALLLAGLVAGCGTDSSDGDPQGATEASSPNTMPLPPVRLVLPPSKAEALEVVQARTPPLPVPQYRYVTSGTYPQVSGGDRSLSAVNAAITKAMVDHQRDYVRDGIYRTYGRHYKGFENSASPGIFTTGPRTMASSILSRPTKRAKASQPKLISASTTVVSALVPVLELYPGGNDGSVWMGFTVRAPGGSPVYLRDILKRPKQAIPAIGVIARSRLAHTDKGVHGELNSKMDREFVVRSFAPRAKHGVRWALTPTGFAIGYPVGSVSAVPSGRIAVTIPYWRLGPYLSGQGRELIAGVRWPLGPSGEQLGIH